MLNLYIDTNAYLSFYHLSSEDLEELKKLDVLTNKQPEIVIHLPEQTRDEFNRNRDGKIADALVKLKAEKLYNQFPQMSKQYPEYNLMREAAREFDRHKSNLIEKLSNDIFAVNLAADRIIASLFGNATHHKLTPSRLHNAVTRFELGRPPGKNKSYGDALIWETLLDEIPESEDIYFVSDDKDYFSELNPEQFSGYLRQEWESKKNSNIHFYKRISEFFKEKYPDIEIASEYEKNKLINGLIESKSFAQSRRLLTHLNAFNDFSSDQINNIVYACINNSQIRWIKDDEDIKQYISNIVEPFYKVIDSDLLHQFSDCYGVNVPDTKADFEF